MPPEKVGHHRRYVGSAILCVGCTPFSARLTLQHDIDPEIYWHRPIIVKDMRTPLGSVIGRMRVKPEHSEDDVIDNDIILVWQDQKRIITGPDLLARLLRGIVTRDAERN
jgi:hypothetical protein